MWTHTLLKIKNCEHQRLLVLCNEQNGIPQIQERIPALAGMYFSEYGLVILVSVVVGNIPSGYNLKQKEAQGACSETTNKGASQHSPGRHT